MAVASTAHQAEQENFLRTFLRENVRASHTISNVDTRLENVTFEIWLHWTIVIRYQERSEAGRYAGDDATVFVANHNALALAFESYAAQVLGQSQAYTAAKTFLATRREFGFHDGEVRVRTERPVLAWVRSCGSCAGKGRIDCTRCHRTGSVACGQCLGSGRNTCTTCGGTGTIPYTEIAYVGSSATTVYKRRSCSCFGGRVTCFRCAGRGRQTCGDCSGRGDVVCGTCAGTGIRSTVRTMTLDALPSRTYVFATGTSSFAANVLAQYAPEALPHSIYSGSWDSEPRTDIASRTLSYVLRAGTRFVDSKVEVDGKSFVFRTFGQTLRIADGGGIVEHLLEMDRALLASAVAMPIWSAATNPWRWLRSSIVASRVMLDSKIHVHLFNRAHGAGQADELVRGVSKQYEREIVNALERALRRSYTALAVLPWAVPFVGIGIILGVIGHRSPRYIDLHHIRQTVLALPYATVLGVSGFTSLVYFLSRVAPISVFADRSGETALQCLSLVRGQTRAKTVFSVGFLSLAILAAVLATRLR